MDTQTLLALTGFAMAASWTPGPNNMMLAASGGACGGGGPGPQALGVAVGFPLSICLTGRGRGEIFQRWAGLRTGLAWGGFAVILYLGWRIAMAGSAKTGARTRPLNFLEAAAFQWINPKGWVMAVAAAATYASGGAPLREAGVLAAVFLAVSLPGAQGWTLFGVGIGRMLGTGTRLRTFNVTMGLLLASSALLLVLD